MNVEHQMLRPAGILTLVMVSVTAAADDHRALTDALIFHASFDGTTDAIPFDKGDDGRIYTADSMAMKNVRQGNHIKEVAVSKDAGRFGDALRFSAKTEQVLFYKASANGFRPRDNWSGTVSFWMKLNPDEDLPAGFCDPIQITAKAWNDAAFFVDFDKSLPRDFRLGVFSDYRIWNPRDIPWDDFPVERRPMVTVRNPPFARDRWTHVVFTFSNLNSTSGTDSTASLYLNGELQGALEQPMRFTWKGTDDSSKGAVILLGLNYVGAMDDLAIFRGALNGDEVKTLHQLPNGL